MTELCERCQARLGELLQWEIENPAAAAFSAPPTPSGILAAAPSMAPAASAASLDSTSLDSTAAPLAARFAPGHAISRPATSADSAAPATLAAEEAEQAEASPEELRELGQHAQNCEECRRALSLLRSARQVLGELPQLAAPLDLRARIQSQLAPANRAAATSPSAEKTALAASQEPLEARPSQPGNSRPWWALAGPAGVGDAAVGNAARSRAAAEAPLALRRAGLPRTVWAGGSALVAAFCVVLALQLKPPSATMSVSDSEAGSAAPSAPALDGVKSPDPLAQQPSPSTSSPSASAQGAKGASQAAPKLGRASKAPGAPGKAVRNPAKPPGASAHNSNAAAPDQAPGNAPLPDLDLPEPLPEPQMPSPSVMEPRPERPRQGGRRERAQHPPIDKPSDNKRDASTSAARAPEAITPGIGAAQAAARARETAASISVQVEPLPAQKSKASGGNFASAGAASVTPRSAQANSRHGEQSPDAAPSEGLAQSESAGGAGNSAQGEAPVPVPPRRRVRGGSDSEGAPADASASGAAVPTGVGSSAPSVAAPAPAPGSFGTTPGGGSEAGEGSSAPTPRAASGAATTADSGAGAPGANATIAGAPSAAKIAPAVGGAVGRAKPGVRRVTVQVKATRAIRRAQVEVVLEDGWLFGDGTGGSGSRRMRWSGRMSAGQVIPIEVELRAVGAQAPARAARVRLLDVSRARARVVSSADILIPAASGSGPKN